MRSLRYLSCLATTLLLSLAGFSQVSVLTYHNNVARTGQNSQETVLNRGNVNSSQFGKRFSFPVDGQIYAQPLYVPNLAINSAVHNVVFVATQHNSVYAFDADGKTANPLWKVNLGPSIQSTDALGIKPEVGITSTPVIDLGSNTIYVFALTDDAALFRLHALDLRTGAEKFNGPVVVTATVGGSGTDSVNGQITISRSCYQRAGVALLNNTIYLSFGHCSHGWVLAYDKSSLQQTGAVNFTPDGEGGTVWMSGGAPAGDASGNLYLITGTNIGSHQPGYNDSFVKLAPNTSVSDFFTPSNNQTLIDNDADLGSGAAIVMPDNSTSHPHEVIGGGKDGRIFVIDRDNMGQSNSTDQVIQTVQTGTTQYNNIHCTPAYWNGRVYFHSNNDVVRAYAWSGGSLSQSSVSQGNIVYQAHGATVSISSNGNNDGIVWDIDATAQPSGAAVLHAYNADDLSQELYNSAQAGSRDTAGPAVKFTVPTIVNGNVYVSTGTELDVYGLLNGNNTPPFGSMDTVVGDQSRTTTVAQNTAIDVFGWAADKEDGSPVARVAILIDGTQVTNAVVGQARTVGQYTNAGWSVRYNIGNLSPGAHTVTAVAFDSQGASASMPGFNGAGPITVTAASNNTPPFGSMDTVVGDQSRTTTVAQNTAIDVFGWAADKEDGAPVARVAILIDGAQVTNAVVGQARTVGQYTNAGWSVRYNIGNLSTGTHTVTAVAFDSKGASATLPGYNGAGPITVTSGSGNNTPPFGSMDTVVGDQSRTTTVAQNTAIDVFGWAADKEDGSPVTRVAILIDGVQVTNAAVGQARTVGQYTNAGWSVRYNVGNLSVGTHRVTAVAFDSKGASATLPGYNGAGPITVTQ